MLRHLPARQWSNASGRAIPVFRIGQIRVQEPRDQYVDHGRVARCELYQGRSIA
jgi:hypothetical protein